MCQSDGTFFNASGFVVSCPPKLFKQLPIDSYQMIIINSQLSIFNFPLLKLYTKNRLGVQHIATLLFFVVVLNLLCENICTTAGIIVTERCRDCIFLLLLYHSALYVDPNNKYTRIKIKFENNNMKKKMLLLMGIFSLGLLNAQVGVNVQKPLRVLHIDPKGDTNLTGTVGYSDDIVVNEKGYLGIGTISPTAHVHIDKGTASSFIRIEDTSEGTGDKFLKSDVNGYGTWIPRVKLSGKVYRMTSPFQNVIYYPANTDSPILFNKLKLDTGPITNNPDNGYIRIDNDGSYIFTVRWWGSVSGSAVTSNRKYNVIEAMLNIKKVIGGVVQTESLDNLNMYVNVAGGGRYAFTVSLFVPNLKKGELLAVSIKPLVTTWALGVGLSTIGSQFDNVVYFPSVMVYNI